MLQNFTPQQMAGAGSYNDAVLVGNWNEDRNVREVSFIFIFYILQLLSLININ